MAGADKPGLTVGGVAMVVSVATAAAAAGTRCLIVVGPVRPGQVQTALETAAGALAGGLVSVREDPPGGGPVAALRRGLTEVSAPWVAVLAADLPFLTGAELTGLLRAAAGPGGDARAWPGAGARPDAGASMRPAGAVLTDFDGRQQWLAGMWRAADVRRALQAYRGSSLGGLLGPLGPVLVRPRRPARARSQGPTDGAAAAPWLDCDTPAELAAARAMAGES